MKKSDEMREFLANKKVPKKKNDKAAKDAVKAAADASEIADEGDKKESIADKIKKKIIKKKD